MTYRRMDSPGSEIEQKISVSDFGEFWPNRRELDDGVKEENVAER